MTFSPRNEFIICVKRSQARKGFRNRKIFYMIYNNSLAGIITFGERERRRKRGKNEESMFLFDSAIIQPAARDRTAQIYARGAL